MADFAAGEKARRHCLFLNQCAEYFERKAASSSEDSEHQAHANNARNLIAASNCIAKLETVRISAEKAADFLGYLIDHLPEDKRDNRAWLDLWSALRDVAPAAKPAIGQD